MKNENTDLPKGFGIEQEQLYYAKVKGWELLSPSECFWNYSTVTGKYYLANKLHSDLSLTQMTKTEWSELGINGSNADFEKVQV